ncbi:MAG: Rod shape-determining protein MreB [Treponematales bacterium]
MFGKSASVIGMDLGTCNTLIYIKGKGDNGIVLNEPSVIAVERGTKKVVAVGAEAKRMLWRTPDNIVAIRPMRDGVIADLEFCEKMIKHFISQVMPRFNFVKPRMVIGVPSCITEVERRAVEESAYKSGARDVVVIEESRAAAIGANIPINEPAGHMVCDIGGGTTEVSVLSLGGMVVTNAIRVGGDEFDTAIVEYTRERLGMRIGEQTAEWVKIQIGNAVPDRTIERVELKGTDTVSGLPKRIEIDAIQVRDALKDPIEQIVKVVKDTLSQTPPELNADIVERGIVMTGGGSLLKGLPHYLSRETGVPVIVAERALDCVALGAGRYYDSVGKGIGGSQGIYDSLNSDR